ncbi:MAG TPA: hypothetical protein VHY09_13570 [Candidatus Methylacidiphilales bacterium]|jgi:ElaB/YqjD/DUF883 family membrane-anchored ribosome-binding protein|nr:hypothetical protein [Candidatus Methylacidiphilales bacterium]
METEAFPHTRKDVANLKDTAVGAAKDLRDTAATHLDKAKGHVAELKTTAVEAAKDLSSTAAGHVEKAKGQLRDLATHAQSEGGEQLKQVRGQFEDLTESARAYISARPLAAVGVAVAVGFLFGLSRRR